ncbi:hypothetical protein LIP47_15775, partial [Eggerthella lenta]|nr:hypothetical protein [Eggerthella lenta]
SMQEQAESLEQLRLMSAGINIRTFEVAATGPGVDTPACLEKVRALRARKSRGASEAPSCDRPQGGGTGSTTC